MRSKIRMKAPKKIVGYCIKDENIDKLTNTAQKLSAELVLKGKESAGETVGYAVGFTGFEKKTEVPEDISEEEMIVFSGFDNKEVDKALEAFDEAGLDITLKAVVTSKNQKVTLSALSIYLALENAQMNG